MKALLVTGIGKLAIAEIPLPQLRAYEALVEVEACGICNSTDHKLLTGQFVPGPFPTALGHESAGKIVAVGEKVRHFQPGQRVLRSVLFDRHVPGGRATWGGFSEYAIVVDGRAVREDATGGAVLEPPLHWSAAKQQVVPEAIKPAQAVAMITLKETLSCLQNFGVTGDSAVAVVGTGPVGQAFAFEARLLGASPVVVFGRRPFWRERFAQLGVQDYVVGEDWPPTVSQMVAGGRFSHIVEAVGSREALSLCLKLAGQNGKVGLYGIPPEDAPYDPAELTDPRVSRPPVEEADVHDLMLEWVGQGKVNLDQWYSSILPWTDFVKGFDMVEENHAAKVVLSFR